MEDTTRENGERRSGGQQASDKCRGFVWAEDTYPLDKARGTGHLFPASPFSPRSLVKTLFVTGGAGFIGSALVRMLVRGGGYRVVTIDKLTYAGNLESLGDALDAPNHRFVKADIGDAAAAPRRCSTRSGRPASSTSPPNRTSTGRSTRPADFIHTNVVGTFTLLQESLRHLRRLAPKRRAISGSCTSRPTRSSARSAPRVRSPRRRRIRRARRTPRARRRPIISRARGSTPTGCRRSRPTARTTTGRISFRKSSFRW